MKKEAMFWNSLADNKVQCNLCAHQCTILPQKRGICRIRENQGGKLYTLIYNTVSSINVDPIEKKPLFHFYPGSMALSLGTIGCNFRCKHCQNYAIAAANVEEISTQEITPEKSIELAKQYGCHGISWTYNEPTIWFEYTYDSAKLAKKAGLYTVYVTNGFMTEAALNTIAPYLDAANVDVKAFDNEFYRHVCGAKFEPVLRTCERMKEKHIHLEITYLIIPGYNDGAEEIKQFSEWVVGIGADTPVHFSRFHPHYRMTNISSTPLETLEEAHKIAKECGIEHVYIGNVFGHRYESMYCPKCDELLIERRGHSVINRLGAENRCPTCGRNINIRVVNGG